MFMPLTRREIKDNFHIKIISVQLTEAEIFVIMIV